MGLLVNHRLTTVLASIVAGFTISLNIFLDCTRPSLEVVSHVPADNTGRSHFLCPSRRITSRRVGSSDSGASGTSRCHAKVTLLHIMEHHAPTTIQSECEVFRQCGSSHYGTNQLPTAAVGACRDACG